MEGTLDLIFIALYTRRDFFTTFPFRTFTRSLIASQEYLQRHPVKKMDDLKTLDLIGYSSPFGDFRVWCHKHGLDTITSQLKPQMGVAVVNEAHTMNRLILNGCGAGFAFDDLVQDELSYGQLVKLFPELSPMTVTIDVARRKIHTPSFLLDTFLEFLRMEN